MYKKILILIMAILPYFSSAYAEVKDTLVIGKVSSGENNKDRIRLEALVKRFAAELSESGISKIDVLIAKNASEMIQAIKQGKVDWVSDSLFMSLLLAESTRAEVLLSKTTNVKKYSTVFFVKKNSKAKSINNLENRIIIFPDAVSSSDYFIPFYELTNHSYTPKVYGQGSGTETSEKKRILYRFQPDQSVMFKDVLKNELNIGIMRNIDYQKIDSKIKAQLKVVYETVPYPETLELIRSGLDIEVKIKLKSLLKGVTDQAKNSSSVQNKSSDRRLERFIADGRDGYVYLRGIIKHEVVPFAFDNKKNKSFK